MNLTRNAVNVRNYITKLREISHPQLKGILLTAEKTREIKEPLSELFTPPNHQSTQVVRIPKEKKSIQEIFADNGSSASAVLGRLVGHLREECPGAIVASRASGARG